MSPYEFIRLTAQTLGHNETARGLCPWCHGGNTKEESFVVTRIRGTVKYHCFRNSCPGKSGMLGIDGTPLSMDRRKTEPKKKEFDWDTFPLSDATLEYIWHKYYMTAELCQAYGLRQTRGGDIVVPTYNRMGTQNGVLVRLRTPRRQKVLTFLSDTQPKLAWYPDGQTGILVVVEDVFSAMRVSEYVASVALLGTHLNVEQAVDIALGEYRRVILMLDQDASSTAVKLLAKHRTTIPGLEVRRLLDKDVKNMTPNEADKWFQQVLGE